MAVEEIAIPRDGNQRYYLWQGTDEELKAQWKRWHGAGTAG